jgi:hypothetical protein
LPPLMPSDVQWRTSVHSPEETTCVEIGKGDGIVLVRDSKDRSGPLLLLTHQEWIQFVNVIRSIF